MKNIVQRVQHKQAASRSFSALAASPVVVRIPHFRRRGRHIIRDDLVHPVVHPWIDFHAFCSAKRLPLLPLRPRTSCALLMR